ncbi:MAG: lipopolysaccharide biosynthesis protein [Prevotella sp.]|nr:lipopolysaccharide biosynthesis protein [Prevotella sp.]
MENLKEKTAKGIAWGAINNGATQLLNLVFGIFLGRLLSTDDYGILALITIFTLLAGCIQAAGFSQALANLKPPTRRDYNAVAWFNIIAGFTLYAFLFLCAPLIARFFDQPVLTDVSRLAFLAIPISAIGIVPNAKLWIELCNREQAIASIVALLASGCCGVWLAWNGYGYWSLAWQQVIYISVANILKYYFTRWCPTLPVDFSPIRRMFNFSSKMLLTNMLTVISQSVLTFIFGKLSAQNLLSISEVGLFNQANKWNTMGSSLISNTMAQVAQPVLANVNNEEERQERVFRKMLRFASFLSFPMMFGLSLVAHEFILTTVGPTWESCVPLLQMLCVGGACLPLQGLYQNFIISRGRSDIYLRLVALQIVLQIVLTLSLSAYGISVMVAAFSALNVLYTGCWHLGLRRIHALSATDVLKDTVPFAVLAAVVMVATHFLTLAVDVIWLLLLVRIIVAGALYFVVMRLLNVDILQECLAFAKSRFL